LVKTQIMAIDIFNGSQSWVRSLYTAL